MKVKRVFLFASLCFVFSIFPFGSAFAYDGVVAGPLNGSNGNQVYVVNAHSRYDATEYLLGLDYSSLTADQRAYLSNESTGGAFYQYVHSFQPLQFGNYPEGFLEATYYTGLIAVYGSASLFWIETNAVERAAAVASYTAVVNGQVGGGGGSGDDVIVGDYTYTPWSGGINSNPVFTLTGIPTSNAVGSTVTFDLSSLRNWEVANTTPLLYCKVYSGSSMAYGVYFIPEGIKVMERNDNHHIYLMNTTSSNKSVQVKYYAGGVSLSGGKYTPTLLNSGASYSVTRNNGVIDIQAQTASTNAKYICWEGDGSTPVVPPSNWPEPEPTPTPEPPELPTPPSNPTVPIEPEPPTYPSPIIVGGTTQSVDIQGILDAMDEHCQHLQSAIATGFSNYYTKITTYLRQLFDWLRQVLQGMMDDWTDYFDDALHWLADQFDFTFTGSDYDDSSILFWLKRIWLKLGNGNSSRPVDPVTDPFGIGEWLNQLLQNLVLDLLALGANVLADIVESFRELITKFPFCIPWDIAAMLALLVSEPVAPSVDVPAYTVTNNGLQQVGTYHIDLEDYDDSMEGVRAMETLVFAFWLAFKTDFFKGVLSMGGEKQ